MKHDTMLAGVIGCPIGHSKSPALHGHWLRRYGLQGHYIPVSVHAQKLASSLESLVQLGFRGVNVTIPHKEHVLRLAGSVSDVAGQIGAANTLTFLPDGSIHADNSDCYGFLQNVTDTVPSWCADRGPALVLGGGGASRAVVAGLLINGAPEVRISNRTRLKAEEIKDHFGTRVVVVDWNDRSEAVSEVVTIVNTTSLGMIGQEALSLDLSDASDTAVVSDIVYNPLETPLLTAARQRNLHAVDGLGMLLHQAVPGFERWFGKRPAVDDDLRQAILSA